MSRSVEKMIHYFSDPIEIESRAEAVAKLGGKGFSLNSMTAAGLPVPPGFTITTMCCLEYFEKQCTWPAGLEDELRLNMDRLEKETGRKFGEGLKPLLVSVRSGAPESMPGMMDTILNCGINPGLREVADSPEAFWKSYAKYIMSFAGSIHPLSADSFYNQGCLDISEVSSAEDVEKYLDVYRSKTGRAFPSEPWPALIEAINGVFNSWNSDRAQSFRKQNGLTVNTGTAVSIQMMFPSMVSGVVFTRMPSEPEAEKMVIESSFGLGEAVVSGDADPDRFIIGRPDLEVLESHIGRKQTVLSALGATSHLKESDPSLSTAQLQELGALALKVEEYAGYPLDIEFGHDGSKLALLQSRRIRGLELAGEILKARDEEKERLKAVEGNCVRITHNISETLKYPTPLTWDILRFFMSGEGGIGEMYRRLGYAVEDSADTEFLELICGSIYADPERMVQMLWRGMPVSCDVSALKDDISKLDNPPVALDPEKSDPFLLLRLPALIWNSVVSAVRVKKLTNTVGELFEREALPEFLSYMDGERRRDLASMNIAELRSLLSEMRIRVLREFGADTLIPGFLGAVSLRKLTVLMERLLGKTAGDDLVQRLTGSLDTISGQQYQLLLKVACGDTGMEEFLEKHGHRTPDEMELAVPRWRETPGKLSDIIKGMNEHEDFEAKMQKQKEIVRGAELELLQQLPKYGASSFTEQVLSLIGETRRLLPYRENGKHYLMMGYELLRNVIVEIGKRMNLGDDVFYLRWEELLECDPSDTGIRADIESRKLRQKAHKSIYLPQLIDADTIDLIGRGPVMDENRSLPATPVSPGACKARARILFEPAYIADLNDDFILVCPSTDPGWMPLLAKASGLIVEKGGVLSHGALIARDLGLPAVVLPDATRIIRDGSLLTVDGASGMVEIEEGDVAS